MIIFKAIRAIVSGIMLFVGIIFIALIIIGVVSYFYHPNEPPNVQEAPWAIQTSSRVYYAKEITNAKGNLAIRDYWISDGGGWKEYKTEIVFDKRLYGQINIIRRIQ